MVSNTTSWTLQALKSLCIWFEISFYLNLKEKNKNWTDECLKDSLWTKTYELFQLNVQNKKENKEMCLSGYSQENSDYTKYFNGQDLIWEIGYISAGGLQRQNTNKTEIIQR